MNIPSFGRRDNHTEQSLDRVPVQVPAPMYVDVQLVPSLIQDVSRRTSSYVYTPKTKWLYPLYIQRPQV